MNSLIKILYDNAVIHGQKMCMASWHEKDWNFQEVVNQKFAELIISECIKKIETYRIPVGNSAAGEMACEWTYDALKEIRTNIKEHFGVK